VSILSPPKDGNGLCPGCAHLLLLEELAGALDRLGKRPDQVCVVTDVGCVGLTDRYVTTHTFHGLHGRSVTYAEGIKRVRPDLTVIVLIGDGACGIAAGHLIHAARRNVAINVLVCNNFRPGGVAGQCDMSMPGPDLAALLSEDDPSYPFDICRTAVVNGAVHVGRYTTFDPELGARLEDALRADGFTLIDCWEPCRGPARESWQLSASDLLDFSERLGLPLGLLHDDDERKPEVPPAIEPEQMSPRYQAGCSLSWKGRSEVCIAGSNEQYIRFSASVLGGIATAGGVQVVKNSDHPIAGRGGYTVANLILSDQPIRYTGGDDPDLVIILSDRGEQRLGSLGSLKPNCLVVADRELVLTPTRATVVRYERAAFEREVGTAWTALAVLAMAVMLRGLLGSDALLAAAKANVTGRLRAPILQAIHHGVAKAESDSPDR